MNRILSVVAVLGVLSPGTSVAQTTRPGAQAGTTGTWNTETGFKSRHPGGANFLKGDGSVEFVGDAINMRVFQYLGAKADGSAIKHY